MVETCAWDQAEPDQRSHLFSQAQAFEQRGSVVDEIELLEAFNAFQAVMTNLMLPEVAHQYRALRQPHGSLLSDRFTQKVDEESQISAVEYLHAIAMRQAYQH
ncbi:MAG: hypothetical protein WBA57_18795 [Elainellaceae cyanobacterium]